MTDFIHRTLESATLAAAEAPLFLLGVVGLVAFAGGGVPGVPVEPVLLLVAAIAPEGLLLSLVAVATIAQMIARTALYFGGRGSGGTHATARSMDVNHMCAAFATCPGMLVPTVMASATLGVPPFHVTTLACGALRLPFGTYLALGTAGRVLRFTAIVLASRLFVP